MKPNKHLVKNLSGFSQPVAWVFHWYWKGREAMSQSPEAFKGEEAARQTTQAFDTTSVWRQSGWHQMGGGGRKKWGRLWNLTFSTRPSRKGCYSLSLCIWTWRFYRNPPGSLLYGCPWPLYFHQHSHSNCLTWDGRMGVLWALIVWTMMCWCQCVSVYELTASSSLDLPPSNQTVNKGSVHDSWG